MGTYTDHMHMHIYTYAYECLHTHIDAPSLIYTQLWLSALKKSKHETYLHVI